MNKNKPRDMSKELGALTDLMNTKILAIEEALNALNYTVSASVSLGSLKLTYGKHDNEWGLYIEAQGASGDKNTPLVSTSRGIRIQAIDALPMLIEELNKRSETELACVQLANDKLDRLLLALGAAPEGKQ